MTNYGVQWAKGIVAARPQRPSDVAVEDRAEVFAELAAAYQVLTEQAVADGDADRAIACGGLAEHYGWLAEQWRREGDLS